MALRASSTWLYQMVPNRPEPWRSLHREKATNVLSTQAIEATVWWKTLHHGKEEPGGNDINQMALRHHVKTKEPGNKTSKIPTMPTNKEEKNPPEATNSGNLEESR